MRYGNAKTGPRKVKRIYPPVGEDDFVKLCDKVNDKVKVIFLLAYGSGLRQAEVLDLQKEDFDFKGKKLFVRQGKGSKDRVVNIPKHFRSSFLKHIPFSITARGVRSSFLTASIKAGFNPVSFTDKAGRPRYKFHFHCLRSSYITRCLDNGIPIHQVMILAGHNNMATTSKYAQANPTDAIANVFDKGV